MVDAPFTGFGPRAVDLLRELAADNSKSWYDANRDGFEAQIRTPMLRLIAEAAERHGGGVKLFRQHRDLRFGKDRSPYKTSTYGLVTGLPDGRALYAALTRDGFYAGTGAHQLSPDQLRRFRAAVDAQGSGEALRRIFEALRAAGLDVGGDSLSGIPRGVARDHPRLELLRLKSITAGARLAPDAALDGRRPLQHAFRTWDMARPLTDWLAQHVGAAREPRARP
ncbi:DUF2461 domain-containing protein [Halovulum marinum]|nr:DUF2461 domain-containing protein [Halovulum marinum]